MKSVIVEKNGNLVIRNVSMPKYNECQALVKMVSCGICNGTDAKLIHRQFKNIGPSCYPLMLGHEGVGRVVKVGKQVTSFKPGDLVLLPFVDAMDGYTSGWGAFSEYGMVCDPTSWDTSQYGPVPECAYAQTVLPADIDPTEAAMIVTLREVLSSIQRFGIGAGDSAVIFGCGSVGLTFIKCMSLLGVYPIIALDIVDSKLLIADSMGATCTFNSKKDDYTAGIRAICPDGVKFVLDAVGISAIINAAMPLLQDQGKICCYGISPNLSAEIDWTNAPYNWQLQFQQFPSKVEEGESHTQIMNWLRAGDIHLKDYISDVYDFVNILEAFEALEKKQIAQKCIIRYPDDGMAYPTDD